MGVHALSLKEPQEAPGTIGHEIRRRLQHGPKIEPWEAVGLFKADRVQQLASRLRPALEAGRVVIQDRSWLSTSVYNGHWPRHAAEDLAWPTPEHLMHHHREIWPRADMTILLDVSGRTAVQRLIARALKHSLPLWEQSDVVDLDIWRKRYDSLIRSHAGWWGHLVRVDAEKPLKAACAEVWVAVRRMLSQGEDCGRQADHVRPLGPNSR